jgi:hypothetical protein
VSNRNDNNNDRKKITVGRVYAVSTLLAVIIAIPAVAVTFVMHYVIRADFFLTLGAGLIKYKRCYRRLLSIQRREKTANLTLKQISDTLPGDSILPLYRRQSYNGRPASFKGSLEGEEFKIINPS